MPGMRLFGRRSSLATDDFLLIGIIDTIIYLPWLGWIPVMYASYLKQRHTCDDDNTRLLLDICLPGLSSLFLLNWLLSVSFIFFSSKGTISQPEPRRHVVKLVYVKLLISFVDVVLAVLGTVILVRDSYCDIRGVNLLVKVCTIFLWLATLARLVMIVIFYDWNFSKHKKDSLAKEYFTTPVRKGPFKKWSMRFQTLFLWCTTPSEARQQAIKTASELMALMSCNLDLVASDVIAGLLLYRQKWLMEYKLEKVQLNETPPITTAGDVILEEFPPKDFEPWMNLQLAKRYCKLGFGVFGWPWFIYRNLKCGCCILLTRLTCFFPFRSRSKIVWGDNCCGCNLAGLQSTSELAYEDLVHVNFVDKVFEVPFFVTYDHDTSAVLITARGTMSMDDVLTDVAAGFGCLDDHPEIPPGALCHTGMLSAARKIKDKLEEKEIIDTALKEKPNYSLVITGHSLGASVATLLTLLYLHKYPNVRCFAFAPSPTMNQIALQMSYRNVLTIIYGNDSVCYLNYENIKGMVVEMVKCLKECNVPKYKVFLNSEKSYEMLVTDEKCGNIDVNQKLNEAYKMKPSKEKSTFADRYVENGSETPCVTETLCVGGKILHIRRAENGYRLRIASADEYRLPVPLRPKYVLDHFPQFMECALECLGECPVLRASSVLQLPEKQV